MTMQSGSLPERSTDGFEIVGAAKKRSELSTETRVVFEEPANFGLYAVRPARLASPARRIVSSSCWPGAVVGLDDAVVALENVVSRWSQAASPLSSSVGMA